MPKVFLSRRSTFSSSHRLHSSAISDEANLALFGKCNSKNGHGHNYVLEVVLYGDVDKNGILFNLNDLKKMIEDNVLSKLDHKNLNLDVTEFKLLNPTAENIAVVCWNWLEKKLDGLLFEIRLHETENNVAIYRGEN